jgi:hypothetical protein
LKEAVVLVETNDIESYVEAIAALSKDESHYLRMVDNARRLRPFILDDSASFLAALRTAAHRLDVRSSKPSRDVAQDLSK